MEGFDLQPGARYYAFLFLHRLLIKYPELKNELNYLFTLGYVKSLSPGIKKSVQKNTLKNNVILNYYINFTIPTAVD